MRVSTLYRLGDDAIDLGAVYASVEGVSEHSYRECLHELETAATSLDANAVVGNSSKASCSGTRAPVSSPPRLTSSRGTGTTHTSTRPLTTGQ
jgi:hypothetical protein